MKFFVISDNSIQPLTLFLTINTGTNVLPSETPLVDLGRSKQKPVIMSCRVGVKSDQNNANAFVVQQ